MVKDEQLRWEVWEIFALPIISGPSRTPPSRETHYVMMGFCSEVSPRYTKENVHVHLDSAGRPDRHRADRGGDQGAGVEPRLLGGCQGGGPGEEAADGRPGSGQGRVSEA